MSRPEIECYFIMNGKDYAFRAWKHIPRVGELVELGATERKVYKITQILWGEKRRDAELIPDSLYVNIYIEESTK